MIFHENMLFYQLYYWVNEITNRYSNNNCSQSNTLHYYEFHIHFDVKYKAWITNDYVFFVSDTIKFDIIITCPSSICCCWNEKRLFSCCKSYYFHLQLCTPYKFMTVQGLQHKVPPTGYCSNSVSITRGILGPCHLYIVFI